MTEKKRHLSRFIWTMGSYLIGSGCSGCVSRRSPGHLLASGMLEAAGDGAEPRRQARESSTAPW